MNPTTGNIANTGKSAIPEVDAEETAALLARLVSIDSQNPDLVPEVAGEEAIAQAVAELMREAGLEVELVVPAPGRPSVVARLRGSGGGRTLLLNAHMDTVALGEMEGPLEPETREGRMYGRGAYDMKGGLTAILMAARTLVAAKTPLAGDLLITAVADEEYASIGTSAVLESLRKDGRPISGAVVTEPTELELCVAHKGFVWAQIETRGRAAHGSRRSEGIDAIFHMGRVLTALEKLDEELQTRPAHPLLGHASLHASLISGGTGLSTYPDGCLLEIERRTLPGEDSASVEAELRALLDAQSAADPQFDAAVRITLYRASFEVSFDAPVVQLVAAVSQEVLGAHPRLQGATYWMDAALISEAGIPTVIFGPVGEGAHAAVEWVDVESVVNCAQVLVQTVVEFCGSSKG